MEFHGNIQENIANIHGYFCQKSRLLAENIGPVFRFAERKILYTPLTLRLKWNQTYKVK
jgi:hypothetical protein